MIFLKKNSPNLDDPPTAKSRVHSGDAACPVRRCSAFPHFPRECAFHVAHTRWTKKKYITIVIKTNYNN